MRTPDETQNNPRQGLRWETYFNAREPWPSRGAPDVLQARLSDLASQLESLQVDQRASEEQLGAMRESLNAAVRAGNDLTARVRLPPPESMEVTLVAADGVDRLEEHHANENRAWAFLGITVGAALGQVTELALAGETPPVSVWMLFLFLIVASVYFTIEIKQNRTRIAQVKAKTFYHLPAQES